MKIIYALIGSMSLALGTIGIVLPILPTVPFYMLTVYFYAKSSDKLHDWFIDTKLYQKHLKTFVEERAMTRRKKWLLLIFVDLILLVSFLSIDYLFLRIIIVLLFIIKHIYFYRYVKVIKP